MTTATLTHDDLFDGLANAQIAIEFAHIVEDHQTHLAAEADLTHLVAEALSRGYILDTFNCEIGDPVQNNAGDTGTVTDLRVSTLAPRIDVRWDAPSPHRTVFTAAHLSAGELRHQR